MCLASTSGSPGNEIEIGSLDTVPRDRLLTTAELFALLNENQAGLDGVFQRLAQHDTSEALQALAEYFAIRRSPKFFFEPADVESRAREFMSQYPDKVAIFQSEVQEYRRTYGTDLDWRIPGRDLLGRSHTANTIRFLARQAFASKTAFMFYYSGKSEIFIEDFIGQAKDFIADYENGKTQAGANDVFERYYAGHRTRNWLFAHQLLLASPTYVWQDQILMVKVFLLHGARLYDSCSKFHWGNHQLHGLEGLFEITLMYPEFPVMQVWHRRALELILEHQEKEIMPDGFQFERASHYFKLDIMNYFRVYRLSELNGIVLPKIFYRRFRKMFDAIVALAKPDRTLPVLHDAQDVYARQNTTNGVAASNDAAELADLHESFFMSLGATLFDEPTYKFFGEKKLPAGLYWFLEPEAASHYANLQAKTPAIGSVALQDSKYFVMRSGWSPDDLYMIIDAGLAKHKPDHSHGQVLGVIAQAFGEDILPNYRVRYSDLSYRTLKNSLVKNIATADHQLQGQGWIDNKARTGFGIWDRLPTPTVSEWLAGNNIDYFSGSHDGFESFGVDYTRSIFFFKPFCWVIIDKFHGTQPHSFQQIWQGDYAIQPNQNLVYGKNALSGLLIKQAEPSILSIQSSEIYGKKSVQFEKCGASSYTFTTLLQPYDGPPSQADVRRYDRPEFQQIVVTDGDRKEVVFFNGQEKLDLAQVKTDADFVAMRYSADSLYAVLLCNGRKLHLNDISAEISAVASVELQRQPSGDWHWQILNDPDADVEVNLN